jgi:hypothetical protein
MGELDFSYDLIKFLKNDIIETIENSTTLRFKFHKVVEFQKRMNIMPNVNIKTDKTTLTNYFYEITECSPLDIYVDFIHIDCEEKRKYDDEIKSYYCHYTQFSIWSLIFFPIVLPMDLCRLVYNNLLIYPFVSIKYCNNPMYHSFTLDLFLRKSLVEK